MNHRPTTHLPHRLFALAVGVALTCQANAADVSPGPDPAAQAQYRACLDDEAALRAQRSTLFKNSTAHNTELKKLQAEMDAHLATQDKAMGEGGEAIRAFNTKLEALNTRAEAINRRGEDYDRQQAEINERAKALNARCANLSVRLKDRGAVYSERATAKDQAASAPRRIELNPAGPK